MRPTRRALAQPPADAAVALLGAVVVSVAGGARVAVRLTEVEAYGGVGDDPASHAHRGRTPRNATMFGPPGHAYVYFTYGMHWCLNIVAGPPLEAGGVLLRAGEVVDGVDAARARRPAARRDVDLARGPARLAAALGVDGSLDGTDLLAAASPLRLVSLVGPGGAGPIVPGPRVGVSAEAARPWRFWLEGDPTVSAYRPAARNRRTAPAARAGG